MISNQMIQNTIDEVSKISGMDFYVLDTEANVLAGTEGSCDDLLPAARAFIDGEDEKGIILRCWFYKIFEDGDPEFILIVKGDSRDNEMVGRMLVFQIESLLMAYKDRYDKDDFIKNLLLDNLLFVDIMNRAQKLHITMRKDRVVILVETEHEKDNNILETVKGLFVTGRDVITAVDEKDVIIVHETDPDETYDDIEKLAWTLVDMLGSEAMTGARVAYGTVIHDLKEVSRSYKEAKMALDVGRIFYTERLVNAYSKLGIGRLIYQLPLPLCKMFINEIFGEEGPIQFDEETLGTVDKFFENNLNVSKTSRELYIHRNTLVYRLDRLVERTGLDIQTFDGAITFQIALMVMKYMSYLESSM